MFEWILSSSILILVVIILRYSLKGKISLRLQYAVWGLVLLRLLLPGSLFASGWSVMTAVESSNSYEAVSDALETTQVYSDVIRNSELTPEEAKEIGNGTLSRYEGYSVESGNSHLKTYSFKDSLSNVIPRILKPVWIAGMTVFGVCFLCSNILFLIRLKRSRREFETDQICCNIPIYITDVIDTPCLFGLFYPAIYVTSQVAENDIVLNHVLTHETTHYLHRDQIWSFLRCVCLILHWYNPLVWLAAELSRRDGELACDESTIEYLGESRRVEYGRTLIDLTCTKRGGLLTTATTMTGSKKSLKERIQLIAEKPKMALCTLIAVVLIAAVAVLCTFTGSAKDMPWHWARTLSGEEVTRAEIWSINGTDHLTEEETAQLVDSIQKLNRLDFSENKDLSGTTPECGFTLICGKEKYNINQAGYLEMSYGDSQWWIKDKKLEEIFASLMKEHFDYDVPTPLSPAYYTAPWEWAEAVTVEDVSSAFVYNNHREYTLPEDGVKQLVDALNQLEKHDFSGIGTAGAHSMDYGILLKCDNLSYFIRQQGVSIKEPLQLYCGQTMYLIDNLKFSQLLDSLTNLIQKGEEIPIFSEDNALDTVTEFAPDSFSATASAEVENSSRLTAEEIKQINETLKPYTEMETGNIMANPLWCFFTSYYENPENIDLNEFLAYFPYSEIVPKSESTESMAELEALRAHKHWPFGDGPMAVPIHKMSSQAVNDVLERYTGVTASEIYEESSSLLYLEEYDSYYNFTSDAGGGYVQFVKGEKQGDHIILYTDYSVLTIRKSGEEYQIQSFLPIE